MKHAHFCIRCVGCGATTSKVDAAKHDGLCKACAESGPSQETMDKFSAKAEQSHLAASREEQHARYIDSGWNDDRGESYD
jgi:hypothetical protein